METRISRKGSRAVRPMLPALAAAVAAAAVGVGGLAAARADAAPKPKPPKTPKIKHGVLTIEGTDADDAIAVGLQPGQPGTLQVDFGDDGTAEFTFARTDFTAIDVEAGKGDDVVRINELGGLFTDAIPTTLDGEDGDDTLRGGSASETLQGGNGNDTIAGNRGNDTELLGGNGDDTFVWNPGDASDTNEGQAGNDTMRFNGSNIAEQIVLSANGDRFQLTRNIAAITMDANDVEQVELKALSGADTVTANDLAPTDVRKVNIDLAATIGGGDGSADRVLINGTGGSDNVHATEGPNGIQVAGLAATVTVSNGEPGSDVVAIDGLGGSDQINADGTTGPDTLSVSSDGTNVLAFGLVAPVNQEPGERFAINGLGGDDNLTAGTDFIDTVAITLDGGTGNDTINGSIGADRILGGDGNDTIAGNRGNDTELLGGNGDDTFVWNPGDGSDTNEGQAGNDTMRFNGSNIAEQIVLSANGDRFQLTRNIAAITMDANDVEQVELKALSGADTVTANDLAPTDVRKVNIDLAATIGGGDGSADQVVVNGTAGNDTIVATPTPDGVSVTGLAAQVAVLHPEAGDTIAVDPLGGNDTVKGIATTGDDVIHVSGDATGVSVTGLPTMLAILNPQAADDTLEIDALAGDDVVDASGLAAGALELIVRGGDGGDVLIGSDGADVIFGEAGDDVLIGGPGQDALDGGPGANVVIQD